MNIRKIQDKDIAAVSSVCLNSFNDSIAISLTNKGISTFSKIASISAFCDRVKEDNLIHVAEDNGTIKGVIELKEGRHLAMLFVDPKYQKQSIGKKLLFSVLPFCRGNTLTVSASISSVKAYEKYGFECSGEIAESEGLVYQPMEIELNK